MVTEPLTKPALVRSTRASGAASGRSLSAASSAGSTIVIAILLIAIFRRSAPCRRCGDHATSFTSTQFDTSDDEQLAFGPGRSSIWSSITAPVLAVPRPPR